jgi:hypothetical protein
VHHLAQKWAVLTMLVWQAGMLCDVDSLLVSGRSYNSKNRSSDRMVTVIVISYESYNRNRCQNWKKKKLTDTPVILYQHTISNKISILLEKCNIGMIHIPKRKRYRCHWWIRCEGPWCILDFMWVR